MANYRPTPILVLMSVRLVQPGRLGDVLEGVNILLPEGASTIKKDDVATIIGKLRDANLICLYAGQRYELTSKGNQALEDANIKDDIDVRRIFLLKASRRDSPPLRSDTRDGSL